MKTISDLMPRQFPKEFLETQYAWMNHASNSPLLIDEHADDNEETIKEKLQAKKDGNEYVEEHHV